MTGLNRPNTAREAFQSPKTMSIGHGMCSSTKLEQKFEENKEKSEKLFSINDISDKFWGKSLSTKKNYVRPQTQRNERQVTSIKPFELKTKEISELKKTMHSSDIFFFKGVTSKEDQPSAKSRQKENHQKSDILNQENNWEKSSEQYLLNNKAKEYSITSHSKSDWIPKTSTNSVINHASVPYNIVSGTKGVTRSRQDIKNAPLFKKRMLCEYYDYLAPLIKPNPNLEMYNAYKTNCDVFRKTKDYCGTFFDNHKNYDNLCTKPFKKKLVDASIKVPFK